MKVSKFGGTSLASAQQIKKMCEIILSDKSRKIIVVSAPGKRNKDDTKVTDLLIKCGHAILNNGTAENELNAVINRFSEIIKELNLSLEILEMIENDLRSRLKIHEGNNDKYLDSIKAAGEDMCAKIVAAYLKSIGIVANYVNPKDAGLYLSDEYGNARVLPESFDNLKKLSDMEGIVIFPGFFGYSHFGNIVTFSRGGSDITGAILAAAVNADIYENFTDVDSVFVANPNIIENPKAIFNITYREMRELSYAGFSVLHEETLEPVFRKGIPVYIKNTNNISSKGTMITLNREINNNPIAGIASDNGFCSINISKYLMNREIGFGRKLLAILEDESISYEHIPSGIDNISIILKENDFSTKVEEKVLERIKKELLVDDVYVERDLALVMVVGEGMTHSIGMMARTTKALSKVNVNIEMISQGASEVSMVFGVKAEDNDSAVKVLYQEFFG